MQKCHPERSRGIFETVKLMNKPKLIVYDFDGVMTDNRAYIDSEGREVACVHRGDGLGVGIIKKLGIQQLILSTERVAIVARRGEKLGIPVIHNVPDKAEALVGYLSDSGFEASEVMYIGNDVNDMAAMSLCGIKGAPADAEPEILKIADWVSAKNGGFGVVRDLARILSEEVDG